MIFHEIYSAYYDAVAQIIAQILSGNTDEKALNQIVCEKAFGESMLTVLPSLKSEKWQLIRADLSTPLKHKPTLPPTLMQKQWLKAVSLDPRVRLFGLEFSGLEDVTPLFTPDDYLVYDKYSDGDPYNDAGYIARFQTILSALRENRPLRLQTTNRRGGLMSMTVLPKRLEYSEKDDKFRLITAGCRYGETVNLARIVSCEADTADWFTPQPAPSPVRKSVTLRIQNDRNALERCLLHFAHFEKQAERLDHRHYFVHIKYEKEDETEMVIRILSFGPMVEVIEPARFRTLIVERLQKQKSCELF